MNQVTVMVTLNYPDPAQPPDLEYLEADIERVLISEMENRSGAFRGCSQIEAEVEEKE
jgi:hypothetical protein